MLNEFLSRIKKEGLAKSNRYVVEFGVPQSVSADTDLLRLYCDSVTLPGINLATANIRTTGDQREMVYERTFEPITFTFYMDVNYEIRSIFEKWMNLVVNPNSSYIGYFRDYVKDITITPLNMDENFENPPYQLKLYEAYPKTMSAINLGYGNNEVMKLTITVSYSYWRSSETTIEYD